MSEITVVDSFFMITPQATWLLTFMNWKDGEISHMDYRHMKEDDDRQTAELEQLIETLGMAELEKGVVE